MNIEEVQEFGKTIQFVSSFITACQNKCKVLKGEDDKLSKDEERCLSSIIYFFHSY